jgi:hypothetical protein
MADTKVSGGGRPMSLWPPGAASGDLCDACGRLTPYARRPNREECEECDNGDWADRRCVVKYEVEK